MIAEQKKYSYNPRAAQESINELFNGSQPRNVAQLSHLIKFPEVTGSNFNP